MAGPPPACVFGDVYPPDSTSVDLTWYRVWPITYGLGGSTLQLPDMLHQIANAGGAVINITFKDSAGNVIPTDPCGNPIVVNPPPSVPPITLVPPTCPPGYTFNPTTEMCDLGPIIIPGPGGGGGSGGGGGGTIPPPTPPPIPPAPPPPDPGGDELSDCCATTALYLWYIATALQQFVAAQPGAQNDKCCQQIVAQLTAITAAVAEIGVVLNRPLPAPNVTIDLSGVVAEPKCICDALAAANTPTAAIPGAITSGLKPIADALAKGTDVSQIVEQLKQANQLQDVPHAIIQQIFADKAIPSQYSGLLQGTPESWVKTVLGIIGVVVPVVGVIENLTGNEDTFEAGKRAINEAFKTVAAAAMRGTKAASGLKDTSTPQDLSDAFKKWVTKSDDLLYPIITPFVDALTEQLKPRLGSTVSIGSIGVDPDEAVATAAGIALSASMAAWALSFIGIDEGESVTHMAEVLGGLVGFEELRDVKLGPLISEGIEKVARMNAKSMFRQDMPGYSELWSLLARGLFDRDRILHLMSRTGLPREFEDATEQAAYSGLNARMMIRLAGTGLFSDADVADELTFSGMRPVSQRRLINAAAYLAVAPERNKLKASLEKLHSAGLISDNDLLSRIDSAEHNVNRDSLILESVQIDKQVALAKEYEAAYSREFLAQLVDVAGYQQALEGLGMQPPDVAARMFRDQTHLAVTLNIAAERAARAEARATALAERKTAIESFKTGTIDSTGLGAALTLTGLTPTQVLAATSYQVLAASGALRWIFGLRKSPAEATLLRERVGDLLRQREIEMLTSAQFVTQLQALTIPPRVINALVAQGDSHISPKSAAILSPVATT